MGRSQGVPFEPEDASPRPRDDHWPAWGPPADRAGTADAGHVRQLRIAVVSHEGLEDAWAQARGILDGLAAGASEPILESWALTGPPAGPPQYAVVAACRLPDR